ncbi:MAG: SH3 domain-containing protein [Myxococcota bacterium]
MTHVVPLALAIAASLIGCFGGGSTETPAPAPQPEVAAPAPAPDEPAERNGFVIGVTSLRKEPTDDRKIDDGSGKQVSNWIATLYRGEQVTVFGENDAKDWVHARLPLGDEGWLKADRVVAGPDVRAATLYDEGKTFRRPDLLALDTDKTIEPGSLLFVMQEKDQFAEVDYPRSGWSSNKAWTLTSELIYDPNEVEVAKVVAKVRHLRAEGSEDAKQLEELARSQFASSRLITLLDQPDAAPSGDEGEGDGEEDLEAGDGHEPSPTGGE